MNTAENARPVCAAFREGRGGGKCRPYIRAGCCMGGAEEEIWRLPWRWPPPSPQLGQDRKLKEIAGPG